MPNNNPDVKKNNFYDQGYFTGLMNDSREAMAKIDESKTPGLEESVQEQLRNQGREELESLLVSTGMRQPEEAFINPDIELFDQNGAIDETKREALLKSMVGYVAFNQSQWIFYPTTSKMTRLTEKAMEENGHDFIHMLPFEKRKEHRAKKDLKNSDPSVVKTYLYPDGTASNKWYSEKGKLSFERLGFKSGFDFQAKYDPNKGIENKTWQAGFNKDEEWEKIEKSSIVRPVEVNRSDLNSVKLVFLEKNEAWLFDENGVLSEAQVTEYFDVHGNLYGATQIDAATTAARITSQLAEMGVSRIAGVVSKNTEKADKEKFGNLFKNYITENTSFYSAKDEKPKQKLKEAELRARDNEKDVAVLASAVTAARIGISGDDYVDLMQGKIKDTRVPLNIFDNTETMELVLASPELDLQPEEKEEIQNYLSTQEIEKNKQQQVSNAVVNILNNRKTLYADSENPVAIEAVKEIVQYVSKEYHYDESLLITRTLGDFIKDYDEEDSQDKAKSKGLNDIISSASRTFQTEVSEDSSFSNDSVVVNYNLFDGQERQDWIKNELVHLVPENTIDEINRAIESLNIDNEVAQKMNKPLRQSFLHFQSIARGSGMKPSEIPAMVKALVTGSPEAASYENKNLVVEKKLTDIYQKAMEINPLEENNQADASGIQLDNVTFSQDSDLEITKSENIFQDSEKMDLVLAQPLLELSENETKEIRELLEKSQIPVQDQQAISNGIINLLSHRKELFQHREIPRPQDLVKHMVAFNKDRGKTGRKVIISSSLKDFVENYDGRDSNNDKSNKIELNKQDLGSMLNQTSFSQKQNVRQYDLFNNDERQKWIEEELVYLIPSGAIAGVEEEIGKLKITADMGQEMSRRIRHAFQNYKSIAQSTGTRPTEIPAMIKALADGSDSPLSAKYQNKSVSTEMTNSELLDKAMALNPHYVRVDKNDLAKERLLKNLGEELRSNGFVMDNTINAMDALGLANNNELDHFVYSFAEPDLFENTPDETDSSIVEIQRIMNQASIPVSQSEAFRSNLTSSIREYFSSITKDASAKSRQSEIKKHFADTIKGVITNVGGSIQINPSVKKSADVNRELGAEQYNATLNKALQQMGLDASQGSLLRDAIASNLGFTSDIGQLSFQPSRKEVKAVQQKIVSSQPPRPPVSANQSPLTNLSYAIISSPDGSEVNHFGQGLFMDEEQSALSDNFSNSTAFFGNENFYTPSGPTDMEQMEFNGQFDSYNQQSGNMEFASSYKYFAGPSVSNNALTHSKFGYVPGQKTFHFKPNHHSRFRPQPKRQSAMSAEEARLARINANYEADKKNIESSDEKSPQTMLAKSQDSQSEGAGSGKGKATDDYAIDKFRDDVLREIKDDCDL